ncbi:MAG: hypothetical protein HYX53_00325 [Chloroflexi bacterium]|nr:hypothetical protein [Chloroflexota bacterium]
MRKTARIGRQQLLAAFLIGIIFAVLAGTRVSHAAGPAPAPTTPGYDISWPQCGEPLPEAPVPFAIVGVNGGRPFTENPCYREQYEWAKQAESQPAVYLNLEYPRETSLNTVVGPAGVCRIEDAGCNAYNFGYNSARDAVDSARRAGTNPTRWWLDVEEMNTWSPDTALNARVISGAIDYLRSQKVTTGAYSTAYQWGEIAGDYRPGIASWAAGARDLAEAQQRCTGAFAFAGDTVAMVQWVEKFDRNWVCPLAETPTAEPGPRPPVQTQPQPVRAQRNSWFSLPAFRAPLR